MVRPTDDGSVRIVIQVPADEAAVVMKAVDESAKRCREEGGEGARLDRVDGVLAMAKGVLAGDGPDRETAGGGASRGERLGAGG